VQRGRVLAGTTMPLPAWLPDLEVLSLRHESDLLTWLGQQGIDVTANELARCGDGDCYVLGTRQSLAQLWIEKRPLEVRRIVLPGRGQSDLEEWRSFDKVRFPTRIELSGSDGTATLAVQSGRAQALAADFSEAGCAAPPPRAARHRGDLLVRTRVAQVHARHVAVDLDPAALTLDQVSRHEHRERVELGAPAADLDLDLHREALRFAAQDLDADAPALAREAPRPTRAARGMRAHAFRVDVHGLAVQSDRRAPTDPSRSSGICSAASCRSEDQRGRAARIGRGRAASMRICQATRSSLSSASDGTLLARRSWRSGSRMASPISAIR
jgi:hypothetical protein